MHLETGWSELSTFNVPVILAASLLLKIKCYNRCKVLNKQKSVSTQASPTSYFLMFKLKNNKSLILSVPALPLGGRDTDSF